MKNGSDILTNKIYGGTSHGKSPLKRVAAIHDLSCFGRCALTVIIPTLSAMGVQVVPVPTCLLSTHTGGFTELHFKDLEEDMEKIAAHFDALDIGFDAIYTGFLGSASQISCVKAFIERFAKKDTLIFVDPVMGDDGELYSTYTHELMQGMKQLCYGANIITPNLTEACFLTDTPYRSTRNMTYEELQAFARTLCMELEKFGSEDIVITGLESGEDKLYVCGKSRKDGFFLYGFDRVNKNYPGTGDLFASVLLGALLRGDDLESALHTAADFTHKSMEYSARFDTPEREGVSFEAFLGELAAPSPSLR